MLKKFFFKNLISKKKKGLNNVISKGEWGAESRSGGNHSKHSFPLIAIINPYHLVLNNCAQEKEKKHPQRPLQIQINLSGTFDCLVWESCFHNSE